MEDSLSVTFAESRSKRRASIAAASLFISKAHRVISANELIGIMNAVEERIEKASNQVLLLTVALGNSLKIQETYDAIVPQFKKPQSGRNHQ